MVKCLKILILSVICSFFLLTLPAGNSASRMQDPEEVSSGELLAKYGQYVYEREACSTCHTLTLGPGDLVSLVGLGGKYPDVWYLEHLLFPEATSPGSEMPGFPKLFHRKMEAAKLMDLCQSSGMSYSFVDSLQLAKKISQQLDEIYNAAIQAAFSGDLDPHSEILALVYYLQQLPASPEKRIQDSMMSLSYLAVQQKLDQAWELALHDGPDGLISLAGSANPEHIKTGQLLFQSNCTPCHGVQGEGGPGPNLTDKYWLHGGQVNEMLASVRHGYPEKGMPSWNYMLKPEEAANVIAYVRSIQGSVRQGGKAPQGKKE